MRKQTEWLFVWFQFAKKSEGNPCQAAGAFQLRSKRLKAFDLSQQQEPETFWHPNMRENLPFVRDVSIPLAGGIQEIS
jgi:hypothetical protein